MGSNWLVVVDAYSKYPCIHQTSSTSTKTTTMLLEEDFAHFGYPHAIVSDNATSFMSDEFQAWCRERGIVHLTGAPYHPATNGAAERLVQTFKQALRKSSAPPKEALQEFLLQYRRTPLADGYSPSELLNGRQIRAKIDTLLPSPAHMAQRRQAKAATKEQSGEQTGQPLAKITQYFKIGQPCYALYYGPRKDKDPRWVPAVVIKVRGSRRVLVRVWPKGPIWRRHIEQLRPRFGVKEDEDPGVNYNSRLSTNHQEPTSNQPIATQSDAQKDNFEPVIVRRREPSPKKDKYDAQHPRRSTRLRKPSTKYSAHQF